ncbi:MAG: hypothetical protein IKL65_00250 [Bacilli bacterium]|nr:hypothetical protein [Bacilli bacterium]
MKKVKLRALLKLRELNDKVDKAFDKVVDKAMDKMYEGIKETVRNLPLDEKPKRTRKPKGEK